MDIGMPTNEQHDRSGRRLYEKARSRLAAGPLTNETIAQIQYLDRLLAGMSVVIGPISSAPRDAVAEYEHRLSMSENAARDLDRAVDNLRRAERHAEWCQARLFDQRMKMLAPQPPA